MSSLKVAAPVMALWLAMLIASAAAAPPPRVPRRCGVLGCIRCDTTTPTLCAQCASPLFVAAPDTTTNTCTCAPGAGQVFDPTTSLPVGPACVPCPPGTYSVVSATGNVCTPCATGMWTLKSRPLGATSAADCVASAPGYGNLETDPAAPLLIGPCPIGSFSGKPNATVPAPPCQPCKPGFTTAADKSPEPKACKVPVCAANTYLTNATSSGTPPRPRPRPALICTACPATAPCGPAGTVADGLNQPELADCTACRRRHRMF